MKCTHCEKPAHRKGKVTCGGENCKRLQRLLKDHERNERLRKARAAVVKVQVGEPAVSGAQNTRTNSEDAAYMRMRASMTKCKYKACWVHVDEVMEAA